MSHSEVHLYHGASQGPNHISRLHESFVSIDPEWASHEIEFHGIKFIPVFRRDWPLVRFVLTGISSALPLAHDRCLYASTLPFLPASSHSRSAR
ncbi:hypothetical protein M405DRAFT_435993 [Rhizopogon salebrosus TDB-379]|nr:hypothetical protein M405DRAFT_435993 [Rhizopogon salebrosus TDB-379]